MMTNNDVMLYDEIPIQNPDFNLLEKEANELVAQGWEIVTAYAVSGITNQLDPPSHYGNIRERTFGSYVSHFMVLRRIP